MESYRIQPFGRGHPANARDLCRLHFELLPHSPVVLLGERFVEKFYYPVLTKMDLLFGAIAYLDGRPVGFIAVTDDAGGFMGRAIIRHPFALAWTMMISVLSDPRRLAALYEAWQIMRGRTGSGDAEPAAELLSFGVLPAYRTAKFVRSTGTKVGQDLFDTAMTQLNKRSVDTVAALVDQNNKEVAMMYRARGWRLHDPDVAGWRTPQVEFRIDLRPDRGDQ